MISDFGDLEISLGLAFRQIPKFQYPQIQKIPVPLYPRIQNFAVYIKYSAVRHQVTEAKRGIQ